MNEQSPSFEKKLSNMSKEEVLLQLLKKEYGYYLGILDITRKESEKLSSGQPVTELKPLLSKKKILLSCINEIEIALVPLKKYWMTKTDRTDTLSIRVNEELSALNKILKEILQLDLISQKTLKNHMSFLREKNKAMENNLT